MTTLFKKRRLWIGRNGQSLMEMIVALTVLMVGFLSIVSLTNTSLGLNRYVTDSYTATYLAVEGIEIVKNVIDNNLRDIQIGNDILPWNYGLPDGIYEVDYTFIPPPGDSKDVSNSCDPVLPQANMNNLRTLFYDPTRKSYAYSAASGEETFFKRWIEVDIQDTLQSSDGEVFKRADKVVVKSFVRWRGVGGKVEETYLEDHFYNWFAEAEGACY